MLIGIGCLVHVVNNSVKTAADKLNFGPTKLNDFLAQIHNFFKDSRSDHLKNINQIRARVDSNSNFNSRKEPTKSFTKTRFLSTGPAIDAIICQWDLFEIFFTESKDSKKVLKFREFFDNKRNFSLLIVLREIALEFETAILQMEGTGIDLISAISIFDNLHQKVIQRKENFETSPTIINCIKDWEEPEMKTNFLQEVKELYDGIQQYMSKWSGWTKPLMMHQWATLEGELSEDAVIKSAKIINCSIDINLLKENVQQANYFISKRQKEVGEDDEAKKPWSSLTASEKWVELLESNVKALGDVANYLLTLPGTNSTVERLFSEIRHFWTDNKESLSLATVNTIMKIRFNYARKCYQVFFMLVRNRELRQKIRDNEKYAQAKLDDANELVNIMEKYKN